MVSNMVGLIKVTQIIHSLNPGGLENGIINLVNNMDDFKFENTICCLTQGGDFEKRLNKNIKVSKMFKKPGNDYQLYIKLIKYLKEIKPTIVHTRNWAGMDGIIAAKMARVPIIIHGEHGFEITDLISQNKKRKFIRKLVLSTIVDKIVTVSKNLKNRLINEIKIKPEKIIHIPNGVDTNKFNIYKKEFTRKKFGFKKEDFIIGIVARLDPIKNHKILISAFKEIVKNYPQTKLIIVGDGPLREELKEKSYQLGINNKVIFMGERNDVPEILKTFDVFVLPSLNEGMSNTILEAMATGIPVIASNVGGNPELVIDGETGFLFPTNDVESLVQKIKTYILYPELKQKHGYNARKRVEEEFSLDQMVRRYEELYLELVERKLKPHKLFAQRYS